MWRVLRPALILGGMVVVFSTALMYWGPISSGMLFLALPTGLPGEVHDLDPSYEPRHGGYVNPGSGLYVREDEDLLLTGTPPFAFKRTYRTMDSVSRAFGIGASNNAEWYLRGDPARHQWVEVILEDGRVRFDRVSWGTSYMNARFAARGDRPEFYGAHLGWTGRRWLLWRPGGALAWFRDCPANPGPPCSLVQLRDADGHTVDFHRNEAGLAQVIAAGGQTLVLEYDELDRVVRGRASTGTQITYTYDAAGRLVRAAGSDGVTRVYTYGPKDELVRIEEPGRVIENTYDESVRVTRQVTERRDAAAPARWVWEFAYRTEGSTVTETDVTEPDGTHTIIRYANQMPVLEIYDARGPQPIMVSIDRDGGTGPVVRYTVRCAVEGRRVTRTADVGPEDDDEAAKRDLVWEACGQKTLP